MHAEASKAQDFLSYTPEEFNQQVEICAYKPDATKESCSKWLNGASRIVLRDIRKLGKLFCHFDSTRSRDFSLEIARRSFSAADV